MDQSDEEDESNDYNEWFVDQQISLSASKKVKCFQTLLEGRVTSLFQANLNFLFLVLWSQVQEF